MTSLRITTTILLDLPISIGSERKKVTCDFWDSLGL